MTNIKELQDTIEMARNLLVNIIQVRENLLHPDIVHMSELLDSLLNEYHKLKRNMEM